jgi:ABC-type branched-subunit amino acid transport system substrate-binding protein
VIAVVLLASVVAACGDGSDSGGSSTTTSSPTRQTSRGNVDGMLALGQLAPLSGRLSSISASLATPVKIAVNEINLAGGVNGKPVTIKVSDDGGGENDEVADKALDGLLRKDKVDAIIGPTATGTALDQLDRVRDAGAIECSGSNSAEELSDASATGAYFRTAPPDRLQALALARLVGSSGRKRPVIVARDDAYGSTFTNRVRRELAKQKITTAGPTISYDPDAPDLTAVAERVERRNADAVIAIALTEDGARLVKALTARGIGPGALQLFAPDGMQSTTFHTSVDAANPGAVRGIVGTAPAAAPASPENAFTAAMRRAGVAPIFSAYYYDCTVLLALAAQQAESDDGVKMRRTFAKSLRGTTDCTSFAACKKALQQGKTIHYRGASSRFDRWDGNEPGQGTYDVWSYGPDGAVVTGPPAQQVAVP